MSDALRYEREVSRGERLRKAQRDLWFLCREVLGYDKLTEAFHKPMLDEISKHARSESQQSMELWPRGHYKTTIRIGQIVQGLLRNPNRTALIAHAVEEEAQKVLAEVGGHFLRNEELRGLRPEMMPDQTDKRAMTADRFTVKRSKNQRQPSLLAKSVTSEVTGAHVDDWYLDDIVGRKTIEDSGLPRLKAWFRSQVMPVMNPGGSIWVSGTRWDPDDPYGAWLVSDTWTTRVRAALETDGKPDYNGTPVLFSQKDLDRLRAEMGESDFAFQMMNDATPASERPWRQEREEHLFIEMKESDGTFGASGPGVTFVLSDPAPRVVGSERSDGEKKRSDGSKDDWATAAIKFRNINGLRVAILLELTTSKDWEFGQGLDECCRMMTRWNTNKLFIEFHNLDWTDEARRAARRNGAAMYLDEQGRLPRFKANQTSKNTRFGSLCSWVNDGRFYICEETMDSQEMEKLLHQCRNYRPLPNGKNTLKYDDSVDIVSRATDPALAHWNAPEVVRTDSPLWSPYKQNSEREETMGTRYVRW